MTVELEKKTMESENLTVVTEVKSVIFEGVVDALPHIEHLEPKKKSLDMTDSRME